MPTTTKKTPVKRTAKKKEEKKDIMALLNTINIREKYPQIFQPVLANSERVEMLFDPMVGGLFKYLPKYAQIQPAQESKIAAMLARIARHAGGDSDTTNSLISNVVQRLVRGQGIKALSFKPKGEDKLSDEALADIEERFKEFMGDESGMTKDERVARMHAFAEQNNLEINELDHTEALEKTLDKIILSLLVIKFAQYAAGKAQDKNLLLDFAQHMMPDEICYSDENAIEKLKTFANDQQKEDADTQAHFIGKIVKYMFENEIITRVELQTIYKDFMTADLIPNHAAFMAIFDIYTKDL